MIIVELEFGNVGRGARRADDYADTIRQAMTVDATASAARHVFGEVFAWEVLATNLGRQDLTHTGEIAPSAIWAPIVQMHTTDEYVNRHRHLPRPPSHDLRRLLTCCRLSEFCRGYPVGAGRLSYAFKVSVVERFST